MTREAMAKALIKHLLSLGGTHVVSLSQENGLKRIADDPDLPIICQRGQLLYPETEVQILRHARPNQCHSLAARHYLARQQHGTREVRLVTGYALSADGIWRSHSWTVQPAPIMIYEPTPEKRRRYFGVVLSTEEAEEFVALNA